MSLVNLDNKLSPKQRQATYGAGFLGVGALILAQVFGIVNAESANSIVQLITLVGGMLGLSAAGVARNAISNQRENGAIIGNPELPTEIVEVPVAPPPMSPVEKISSAVEDVQGLAQGVADGIGQIQVITKAIPGLITMAPDIPGPLDDLAKDFVARAMKTQQQP